MEKSSSKINSNQKKNITATRRSCQKNLEPIKTIAIIPARGQSKRLPKKNLRLLGGKSLLEHSIAYAKANSAIISDVYVSTDDKAIKKEALRLGTKVIERPVQLSGDLEPTITAIAHVLENISVYVENVILLQPTNPLRPEGLLIDAFSKFSKAGANSLFTISEQHRKLGELKNERFKPFNYNFGQRSQDTEPLYYENGLLYITKASMIKKGLLMDEESLAYLVNHKFAEVDIDTEADLHYAEYLLKHFTNDD